MTDNLVERLRDLGIRSADLAADHIEVLTVRAEAAEAREKEYYEGWNACRFLALETIARAEAAEAERDAMAAENNRLREELTKAADSLGWADAHLEDAGVISAQVRYGEKQARAALKGEQK